MKSLIYCAILIGLVACDCQEPAFLVPDSLPPRVLRPVLRDTSAVPTLPNSTRATIPVVFDSPMDSASVIQNETFFLEIPAQDIGHIPGKITWNRAGTSLTFITDESINDYCNSAQNCFLLLRLRLLGSNPDGGLVVRSEDEVPLDGDDNGTSGGIFESYFTFFKIP